MKIQPRSQSDSTSPAPKAAARACQLLGGNLEDYDASTALWIDAYQTQHFTQSESVP